jgi:CRP/FNR family transcriptional regulator, cyclic AMP receptor protein
LTGWSVCVQVQLRTHQPEQPPIFAAAVHTCQACVIGKAARRHCPFARQQLAARSILCSQGALPTKVFFVREGLLALGSNDRAGDEGGLALRGPRSFLCIEALNDEPSPTEVRALSDVELCSVSSEVLRQWIGPESSPGWAVVSFLLSELHQRERDRGWLEGKSLTRVARYLLARDLWPQDEKPLRKLTVARMLGMRPETLSRCLRKLVARGLIEGGHGHRLRDVPALRAMSAVSN